VITNDELQLAKSLVSTVVRHTPMMTSPTVSALCGADPSVLGEGIYLKAETLQRTGSFKLRGAYYRLSKLSDDERARGVVTASAGNHAQGVALAARLLGIPATVYMPEMASIAKVRATRGYGATALLEGRTFDEAVIAAQAFQKRTGAVFVPAYDDDDIIAGQGTLGLEVLEDVPDIDNIVIPVGGGGLFSGVASAIKGAKPHVRIVGVQAEGADTAVRSFHAGKLVARSAPVDTICDGIAIKSPSPRTFEYIQRYADEMVTVPDRAVSSALLLLIERMKLVVEPSGAAGLAALLAHRTVLRGKTVVLLCGGNIDLKLLADLIERQMIIEERYMHIFTAVADKPGGLAGLLEVIAAQKGNILTVNHDRISAETPLGWTGVELLIEVRDKDHSEQVSRSLITSGYPVTQMS